MLGRKDTIPVNIVTTLTTFPWVADSILLGTYKMWNIQLLFPAASDMPCIREVKASVTVLIQNVRYTMLESKYVLYILTVYRVKCVCSS